MRLNFSLAENEYIELFKLLKILKITASGSEAKLLVDEGFAYLNGLQESRRRAKIKPGDTVELKFDDRTIKITVAAKPVDAVY